jgi:hypothetical protein
MVDPRTVPACVYALLHKEPLAQEILSVVPAAAATSAHIEAHGARNSSGMANEAYHTLVRHLNARLDALSDLMSSHPDKLESFFAAFHEEVESYRMLAEVSNAPKDALPPLTTQARNFSRALAEEAKAIMTGQAAAEKAARLEICRNCERVDEGKTRSKDRCLECGCFIEKKTSWRSQSCPLGKWKRSS